MITVYSRYGVYVNVSFFFFTLAAVAVIGTIIRKDKVRRDKMFRYALGLVEQNEEAKGLLGVPLKIRSFGHSSAEQEILTAKVFAVQGTHHSGRIHVSYVENPDGSMEVFNISIIRKGDGKQVRLL
mmetsp:Transcript_5131/g.12855  ORF Transcript_5131/g.12855 Transcript_5131/m.12855 type:complete len:126 (+) Transcript_5131:131-508(+)